MLIDRNDGAINVCEMKFAKDEYVIDAGYEQRLRERNASFCASSKTKKTLLNTFVTTYGIKKNKYSSIVNNEITMDDLFMD